MQEIYIQKLICGLILMYSQKDEYIKIKNV